jgi:hypothetical protein
MLCEKGFAAWPHELSEKKPRNYRVLWTTAAGNPAEP